jgi:prepilin-type N-terminal cleavage/methylation domain-containing protein
VSRVVRGLRRRALHGDSGMTLMETLVAMLIFTIILTIFMATVVTMTRTTTRAQALAATSFQLDKALLRLDKEVRFASALDQPGSATETTPAAGQDWYFEMLTGSEQTTCIAWRWHETAAQSREPATVSPYVGQLQTRTWTTSATVAPSWVTVATNIMVPASPAAPFTFTYPGETAPATVSAGQQSQALDVNLYALAGPGNTSTLSESEISFVARNTTTTTLTNASGVYVCNSGVVTR